MTSPKEKKYNRSIPGGTTAFQWFNAFRRGLKLTVAVGLQCQTKSDAVRRTASLDIGVCAALTALQEAPGSC
jgi:hypothetical protein